jgi:hypothetical protein
MENKGAMLTVAIPLLAFKIWFAILLLAYAPTRDTMVWIAATHWTLLIMLPFIASAMLAIYRLVKVRAKREQLRRAEFMLDPSPPRGPQCSALWEMVSRLEGED